MRDLMLKTISTRDNAGRYDAGTRREIEPVRQTVVGDECGAHEIHTERAKHKITQRETGIDRHAGIYGRKGGSMPPQHSGIDHNAAELDAALDRVPIGPTNRPYEAIAYFEPDREQRLGRPSHEFAQPAAILLEVERSRIQKMPTHAGAIPKLRDGVELTRLGPADVNVLPVA